MDNLQIFYDLLSRYGLSSGKLIIDMLVWSILIVLFYQWIIYPVYSKLIVPAIQYFTKINQTYEKVEKILKEVQTNGGGSLKDAVLSMSSKINEISFMVDKNASSKKSILNILGLMCDGVGSYETDEKGNCTFVSQKWSEITSIYDSDAMGNGWINAIHPEDRDDVTLEFATAVRQERNFSMTYRLAKTGEMVVSYCFPLVVNKKVVGFIGVLKKINEKSKS
jgi:PAS domain S-box-containing protein